MILYEVEDNPSDFFSVTCCLCVNWRPRLVFSPKQTLKCVNWLSSFQWLHNANQHGHILQIAINGTKTTMWCQYGVNTSLVQCKILWVPRKAFNKSNPLLVIIKSFSNSFISSWYFYIYIINLCKLKVYVQKAHKSVQIKLLLSDCGKCKETISCKNISWCQSWTVTVKLKTSTPTTCFETNGATVWTDHWSDISEEMSPGCRWIFASVSTWEIRHRGCLESSRSQESLAVSLRPSFLLTTVFTSRLLSSAESSAFRQHRQFRLHHIRDRHWFS